jgi:hypothetical protein
MVGSRLYGYLTNGMVFVVKIISYEKNLWMQMWIQWKSFNLQLQNIIVLLCVKNVFFLWKCYAMNVRYVCSI